jgi:hypothetical protein
MSDAHAPRGPGDELTRESTEEFGELLRFTAGGYAGGLVLGVLLDRFGFAASGLGQAAVRTLAGEGESLLEGWFALRKRLAGARGSLAQAYGWGKLLGMVLPWAVDASARALGVQVNAAQGFFIPFFYALSDQLGANVGGFAFLRRETGSARRAAALYLRHPVMLTGLAILVAVPLGLFAARRAGFVPANQLLTALETIAANLCWLPPLVGWLAERRRRAA